MEVKKREIIFSFAIIAVMIILGLFISGNMRQSLLEEYQKYDTAVQIDSEELFRYGMKTNIGNAFVYGDLKTLDPVSFPEIEGYYSYIKKEEQKYTKHKKRVTSTYTDSKGKTHTKTEIKYYWTWDTVRTEKKHSTRISFLNVEFEYGKIPYPSAHEIKTLYTGYYKRNVYSATEKNFVGTIFSYLKDDSVNKTSFYPDKNISETIEYLESGHEIIIFWVIWILITILIMVGFLYLENKWLDD
jgi:hypothetical protein